MYTKQYKSVTNPLNNIIFDVEGAYDRRPSTMRSFLTRSLWVVSFMVVINVIIG